MNAPRWRIRASQMANRSPMCLTSSSVQMLWNASAPSSDGKRRIVSRSSLRT